LTTSLRNAALAWYVLAIGCYTLLAPIDGPVGVGAAVVPRSGAILLAASIAIAGCIAASSLRNAFRAPALAASRTTLAIWLLTLIVTAACGFAPGRGFEMIGLAVLTAAVHLALVRWWSAPGVARAVLWTAVGGGLVLALIALAMQITHRPGAVYAANLGRATGLFVTPNYFAAWLVPFTGLSTGVALAAQRRWERWVAGGAAVVGAIALVATFSLGGWLGGAVAFVAGAWWLGRRAVAGGAAATLVAVALVAAFFPGLTHHRVTERFVRLEAMQTGLKVARDFPLLGVGPLAYPTVYDAFRVPSTTEDAIVREHPHDVVVSLLAETGVAGLAAIAFGWWYIGRAIRAAYVRAGAPARRLTVCICAGLIGRFAHGLVDLVGVLEVAFVWIPFSALALAVARDGIGDDGAVRSGG
jgi:O-antigen ligase